MFFDLFRRKKSENHHNHDDNANYVYDTYDGGGVQPWASNAWVANTWAVEKGTRPAKELEEEQRRLKKTRDTIREAEKERARVKEANKLRFKEFNRLALIELKNNPEAKELTENMYDKPILKNIERFIGVRYGY